MHRSRIAVVLIDHPEESYDAAAAFWSGARGTARADGPSDADPYESLGGLPGGVLLELQRTGTGTPPRIHLDLETDDVAAEVARVIALGATVVEEKRDTRSSPTPAACCSASSPCRPPAWTSTPWPPSGTRTTTSCRVPEHPPRGDAGHTGASIRW